MGQGYPSAAYRLDASSQTVCKFLLWSCTWGY